KPRPIRELVMAATRVEEDDVAPLLNEQLNRPQEGVDVLLGRDPAAEEDHAALLRKAEATAKLYLRRLTRKERRGIHPIYGTYFNRSPARVATHGRGQVFAHHQVSLADECVCTCDHPEHHQLPR